MGPGRNLRKKRKRESMKKRSEADVSASGSSQKEESADWFGEFCRRSNGHLPSKNGLDEFKSVFGISKRTFDYICSLVKEDITAKPANLVFRNGRPLSLHDQVAIALRRLSSGESLITVGDSFGLNHSTVSQATWRFIEAMEERASHHLRWPSTTTETANTKAKFEKMCGLPNCCGAIAFTHILMNLSTSDPNSTLWLDHEKHYSMVLQAIVDPDMRFQDIVTGWPGGKMNRRSVFQNSGFYQLCNQGQRLNGNTFELLDGSKVREYVVGGSGYQLLPYLITPYEGKEFSEPRSEFNRQLIAAAGVAESALARLKDSWRIIRGVMWRPDRHRLPRIILVCCLLHNIVIDKEDEVQDMTTVSHHRESGWPQQTCGVGDIKGASLRDRLCFHLTGDPPP